MLPRERNNLVRNDTTPIEITWPFFPAQQWDYQRNESAMMMMMMMVKAIMMTVVIMVTIKLPVATVHHNNKLLGITVRWQYGQVVREPDLKSTNPELKSHSDHQLDLFQVVPGATPQLGLYINSQLLCLLPVRVLSLFSSCTVFPAQNANYWFYQ